MKVADWARLAVLAVALVLACGVPAQAASPVLTVASTEPVGAFDGVAYVRIRGVTISQSAWFINAFIAEGFNADPARGGAVFNGAIAIDGTGNWLAINQLGKAAGFAQYPYPNEGSHPLMPAQLLTRPKSDPFYVDVANFTDFFRLRAGLSESAGRFPADMRRYDWPSPHAAGSAGAAARLAGCNGGVP